MKVQQEWLKQFGAAGEEYAYEVVLDNSGGLYAVGYTTDNMPESGVENQGDRDVWVAKYDVGSGTQLWINQFGSPERDSAVSVTVDGAGGVYIAGSTKGKLPGSDFGNKGSFDGFLAKHDASSGKQLWITQLGNAKHDGFTDIVVTRGGDLYVVGSTEREDNMVAGDGRDTWLAKYNAATGEQRWINQLGSTIDTRAGSLAVDSEGSVYILGRTGSRIPNAKIVEQNNWNVWLAKYDGGFGTQLWFTELGTNKAEFAGRIVLDHVGGVYITGSTSGALADNANQGEFDVFVAKYNTALGKQLWLNQIGSTGRESVVNIAIGNGGDLYIAGHTKGTISGSNVVNQGDWDAWLGRYDADNGRQMWVTQLGTEKQDLAVGLAVDTLGNVYVSGSTEGEFPGARQKGKRDAWIAKYRQVPESFEDIENVLNCKFSIRDELLVRSAS